MENKGDKKLVDKRWGDKPPFATKASKNTQPTN